MKMVKAQGNCMAKCSKVKDRKCKEKTSVARKIKENKVERRRNTNVCRHRRKALKVNRRDALDCCVLLTRLDAEDVKKPSKNGNNMSAKVKQRNKCDQAKLKHEPIQKDKEPKINNSHVRFRLSPEPRRRRMASLNAEAVNSLLLFRSDPLSTRKTQLPKDNHKAHEPKVHRTKRKAKTQDIGCKNTSVAQDQSIDWLSIFAPTPRRQAGLTAATLLKLTSAQYTNKRQKKREVKHESESTTQSDTQSKLDHKIWTQHTRQKTRVKGRLRSCSGSSAQTVRPELENCGKAPLQHPTAPSFSLQVKEEKVENQVSSCYCCTQEQCVQYCHRLALFLRDKSFQGQDSVFHHHHHHHHFPALGTHSYTCFPGYYFHLCHPSDASQEHMYPSSRKVTKLLGTQSSGASGISHPVYCCTSVEPCFDPCTVSSYQQYSSMIPAICHLGCTSCNRTIKKEYPPAVSDLHSPLSLPMCSSPRVLTGCPIPPVPPAGQSVHAPALPSDPSEPTAPLPLGHNCPQSASASRASHVGSVAIRDRKHTPSASGGGHIINKWQHKSTNGWRPVGLPFQREVFTVDEETPVLRTCFEAVQRDRDIIQVRDTVLLKSGPRKKSLPYVAKVSALWEDPNSGELMMSLFWYYRPEHTQGGRKPHVHCENEVFASRHQDVNSVACIEDKCYVLTLAQYCRFRALLKRQQEGVGCSAASVVPPALEHGLPTYHCVPTDLDPQLVFFCRHVYDFRYGRLLKNLH
ncbi:bromo adjacent homology domain-containing 1 protein isoform X1 [Periophthalmus magnuspinnatus]|uniref:bromo adjacent homology domain-containing 1 protein isoform X1 n=1 Tax=Periophthalmus magnuspinnatus TaxID=409849 RepID=UPI0024364C92|nr:bromo adjacent homology domain-containing 1 protein isoform X1 [Periophthalmus magnuspinnatus]